ncbi:TonB-dependent receptor plug domain-containing protein [Porticoccaceae bacterium LTM1]|nr:TonB-dependent receptor plug domain-containing protein [Porticoccaceae bacterium LTM1]
MIRRKRLMLAVASTVAMMASLSSASTSEAIEVDIKSQSADLALMELAKQSGVQIMMSSDAAGVAKLPAISGSLTMTEALDRLLAASGLKYEFTSEGSVVVSKDEEENKSDATKDSDEVEELVVTGSRLITEPGKMTRQMTVFDREEIERSGATRLDEFLRRLPQNVNAPSNIGSGFPNPDRISDFGLGQNVFAGSSVNLRGLGSQYTLILIDGRRPPKGGQFGGITDISNIPLGRVDRIEVLYDGAASIYGADAVGGVVNIITNREFEGTNATLTYSDTTKGGGKRYNFDLGHTFNWDSGSLTATFGYQTQDQIDGSERDLRLGLAEQFPLGPSLPGNIRGVNSRPLMYVRDLDGDGNTLNQDLDERLSGSVEVNVAYQFGPFTIPFGTRVVDRGDPTANLGSLVITSDFVSADGYDPVIQAQLPEYDGELTLYDIDDSGNIGESLYVPFRGNAVSPEDETYSAGLSLNQELSDSLDLSLSLAYSKTEKASNTRGDSTKFQVDREAFGNPFGYQFDYAFQNEFPQEHQFVDQSSISLSGDLNWEINDNWSAEFGFGFSEQKNHSATINRFRPSVPTISTGGEFIPNLWDLFNGFYVTRDEFFNETVIDLGTRFNDPLLGYDSAQALAEAVIDPLVNTSNNGFSRDLDLTFRGNLMALPAGDITTSLTLSHRRQMNEVYNDNVTFFSAVLDGGAPFSNTPDYNERYGSSSNAVGGEIAIPLLGEASGLPFVQDFLINASARYEEYSHVEDSGVNWQLGFNWALNDWMTVRLNRTFSQIVPEQARSARPERGPTFGYPSFYIDENIPLLGAYPDYSTPLWTLRGTNKGLKPEKSDGLALGFIFTPTFVDGLDIQVNISEVETNDQIGNSGLSSVWNSNTILPENIARNPVLRIADPDNNPGDRFDLLDSLGNVIGGSAAGDYILDDRVRNVGSTYNLGADLEVRYATSTDWGDINMIWRHQYIHRNEVVQSDVCADDVCASDLNSGMSQLYDVPVDIVDTIDRQSFLGRVALPRNRGSVEVNWGYRGLLVGLSTTYQQETSIVREPVLMIPTFPIDYPGQQANISREDTKPYQAVNMVLQYDFAGDMFDAPDWLSSTRVSLTVDGVYQSDSETNTTFIRKDFDQEVSPYEINRFTLNPRGRAFSLRINSTF